MESSTNKQEETLDAEKTDKSEEQIISPKILPNISDSKIRCVSENKIEKNYSRSLKRSIPSKPDLKLKLDQVESNKKYKSKQCLLQFTD